MNDPNKEVLHKLRGRPLSRGSDATLKPSSSYAKSRMLDATLPVREQAMTEHKKLSDTKQNHIALLGRLNEIRQKSDYDGVKRGDSLPIKKLNINLLLTHAAKLAQSNNLLANFGPETT
jgi:hypothetical protein